MSRKHIAAIIAITTSVALFALLAPPPREPAVPSSPDTEQADLHEEQIGVQSDSAGIGTAETTTYIQVRSWQGNRPISGATVQILPDSESPPVDRTVLASCLTEDHGLVRVETGSGNALCRVTKTGFASYEAAIALGSSGDRPIVIRLRELLTVGLQVTGFTEGLPYEIEVRDAGGGSVLEASGNGPKAMMPGLIEGKLYWVQVRGQAGEGSTRFTAKKGEPVKVSLLFMQTCWLDTSRLDDGMTLRVRVESSGGGTTKAFKVSNNAPGTAPGLLFFGHLPLGPARVRVVSEGGVVLLDNDFQVIRERALVVPLERPHRMVRGEAQLHVEAEGVSPVRCRISPAIRATRIHRRGVDWVLVFPEDVEERSQQVLVECDGYESKTVTVWVGERVRCQLKKVTPTTVVLRCSIRFGAQCKILLEESNPKGDSRDSTRIGVQMHPGDTKELQVRPGVWMISTSTTGKIGPARKVQLLAQGDELYIPAPAQLDVSLGETNATGITLWSRDDAVVIRGSEGERRVSFAGLWPGRYEIRFKLDSATRSIAVILGEAEHRSIELEEQLGESIEAVIPQEVDVAYLLSSGTPWRGIGRFKGRLLDLYEDLPSGWTALSLGTPSGEFLLTPEFSPREDSALDRPGFVEFEMPFDVSRITALAPLSPGLAWRATGEVIDNRTVRCRIPSDRSAVVFGKSTNDLRFVTRFQGVPSDARILGIESHTLSVDADSARRPLRFEVIVREVAGLRVPDELVNRIVMMRAFAGAAMGTIKELVLCPRKTQFAVISSDRILTTGSIGDLLSLEDR